jgi:hypothetical protein
VSLIDDALFAEIAPHQWVIHSLCHERARAWDLQELVMMREPPACIRFPFNISGNATVDRDGLERAV